MPSGHSIAGRPESSCSTSGLPSALRMAGIGTSSNSPRTGSIQPSPASCARRSDREKRAQRLTGTTALEASHVSVRMRLRRLSTSRTRS